MRVETTQSPELWRGVDWLPPNPSSFSWFTASIQQPNGVFAVIATDRTEFVENLGLGLFSRSTVTRSYGLEVSLTLILAHITVLNFGLPVI